MSARIPSKVEMKKLEMLEIQFNLEVLRESRMAEVFNLQMERIEAIRNDDRSHYDLSKKITAIEKELVEVEMKILDEQIKMAKEEKIAFEHQTCRKLRELKFESSELFEARQNAREEAQKKIGNAPGLTDTWKVELEKRKAQDKKERDAMTEFAAGMECRIKNDMILREMREERDEAQKEYEKLKAEEMLLDSQMSVAVKKLKEFEKLAPLGLDDLLKESQNSLKNTEKILEYMENGIRDFHMSEAARENQWEQRYREADSEIEMLQKAILEKCKLF